MRVTFYRTKSDNRVVSKSLDEIASNVPCTLKADTSLINPIIEISNQRLYGWNSINYMFIDDMNRYYFIEDVSFGVGGIAYVRGHVDVLMSNNSAIRNLKCLITRQENNFNRYFSDSKMPVRVNRKYVYKKVGSLPEGKSNILTVDGGPITAN